MSSLVTGMAVHNLITGYSAEVTTPDRRALDSAAQMMPKNAPVYIASLPKDTPQSQLEVARMLKDLELRPVPHIVARNIENRKSLEKILRELSEKAGVNRALVLGGDRDHPAGEYHSSLQLLQSGVFEEYGITKVAVGCYPEGHPKISDAILDRALHDKLDVADKAGMDIRLITQLCFDPEVIAGYVRSLRKEGISAKIRAGIAGPAKLSTLIRYAAICGVGASLRGLKRQQSMAKGLISTQTPTHLIQKLASANERDPVLDITGIHFFTFASLKKTIEWAEHQLGKERIKDE